MFGNLEKKKIQIDPQQLGISPKLAKSLQQYADRISKAYYPVIDQYQPLLNRTALNQLKAINSVEGKMPNMQKRVERLVEATSFTHQIKQYQKILKPVEELSQANSQILEMMKKYNNLSQKLAQQTRLGEGIKRELSVTNAFWVSQISFHVPPDYLRVTGTVSEADQQDTSSFHLQKTEDDFENEIDFLLSKVDSDLPTIRRGAWETYNSQSEDRWRQASASSRELVNQTLRKLTEEDGNRKEKVKDILSGTEIESDTLAELIADCADVVDDLYSAQSKVTHTNFRHDDATRFVLILSEEITYLLLKNKQDDIN